MDKYLVTFTKTESYEVEANSYKEAEEKAIDCLEADKYAFCDGTIDMIETERIDTNE